MQRNIRQFIVFLFTLICLCYSAVNAQQDLNVQAELYFQQAETAFHTIPTTEETDQTAIDNYQKVIGLYENAGLASYLQAESYQRIGSTYLNQGEIEEARRNYFKALHIKYRLTNVSDSVLYKEYMFLGDIHFLTDRPDSAEWYYYKAETIANRYPSIDEVERVYNSLGALHYNTGNYVQSINFYNKALSLMQNNDPYYLNALVSFTYNIANAKKKLTLYDEAIAHYQQMLNHEQISDLLVSNPEFAEYLYFGLGTAYGQKQRFDSARFYLFKVKECKSPSLRSDDYNSLGYVSLAENKLDSAQHYFDLSIANNTEHFGFKNALLAQSYLGLAEVEINRNRSQEALVYYQNALINSSLNFDDTTLYNNPDNFEQAISLLNLFSAFKGKAHAYSLLYVGTKDQQFLQHSLHTYEHAMRSAHHIQKTYDNDEAKLFLVQKVYPIYEEAISIAYQLYTLSGERQYAEMAFQFSEYSKAAVLSEILDDLEIKSSLRTSDSLIQIEKSQKQQIARLRLQLIEVQDSSGITSLQQELNEHEIALAGTVKLLQKDERFYQLKYQQDSLDIIRLQTHLLEKEDALLEYFLGQDSLYSFLLTQDEFLVKVQPVDSVFYQAISDIQTQLYDYQMGQAYTQSDQAYALYQKLIKPFAETIQDKERLIVIPDGQLNYIPFEMLNDDPISNHYLIFNHAFSYAYSASLLEEAVDTRKVQESNQVLAMAPFAGDEEGNVRNNGFSLLFGSKEEVENIGGSIYLENEATKRLFLQLVSSYGIIHLATHASISNDDPLQSFIAFYPDQQESLSGYRLYTQELYNLRLDSVKLVILSACEAGSGKLVKGEGMISLARAFAYAGCPNIITTLWKAQDKSTAIIASGIHEYLKKGHTKAQALRLAKMDYLESNEVHHLTKVPYYWANFIFIGDAIPVYEASYGWLWWGLAGLLMAAGLFWLVKKTVLKF